MKLNLKQLFSDEKPSTIAAPVSSSASTVSSVASSTPVNSLASRISRLQSETPAESPSSERTLSDVKAHQIAAKAVEPTAEQLIRFVDRISQRKIKRLAEKASLGSRADEFAERVKLPNDSVNAAKAPLSRIIARRVKNDEALDWLALVAVAVEIQSGYSDVAKELNLIRLQNERIAKTGKTA